MEAALVEIVLAALAVMDRLVAWTAFAALGGIPRLGDAGGVAGG